MNDTKEANMFHGVDLNQPAKPVHLVAILVRFGLFILIGTTIRYLFY